MFLPPLLAAGAGAELALVLAGEVGQIGEARQGGGLCDAIALAQELPGLLQAQAHQVGLGRLPVGLPEQDGEVPAVDVKGIGQLLDADRLHVRGLQVGLGVGGVGLLAAGGRGRVLGQAPQHVVEQREDPAVLVLVPALLPEAFKELAHRGLADDRGLQKRGRLPCLEAQVSAARSAKDTAGTVIAAGIGSLIAFQGFMNIAVATMLMPNTGLPLPFVSYGLTSLVSLYIGIGLVLNVRLQRKNLYNL